MAAYAFFGSSGALGTCTGFLVSGGATGVEVTGISHSGVSRGSVDTSHTGLAVWDPGTGSTAVSAFRTFKPGGLIDSGTITLDCLLSPDTWVRTSATTGPPIGEPAETLTIAFANTGAASDATFASSAFLTDYEYTGALDEGWTASMTFKLTGNPTWTASTAA